jgi:hypothetical protein
MSIKYQESMHHDKNSSWKLIDSNPCSGNNKITVCERVVAKKLLFAKHDKFASVSNQAKRSSLGSVPHINLIA